MTLPPASLSLPQGHSLRVLPLGLANGYCTWRRLPKAHERRVRHVNAVAEGPVGPGFTLSTRTPRSPRRHLRHVEEVAESHQVQAEQGVY